MTVPAVRRRRRPALRDAHEDFVTSGALDQTVREVVAESWRRSARSGVDPEQSAPRVDVSDADLVERRERHPLATVIPVVQNLLVEPAAGWVAALTDTDGRLLWVDGDSSVRRVADRVGFVAGADWSEASAGTNAPGTALATGEAVQVVGAEHWARSVQSLNCVAAPVHDGVGRVIGVLDITGGPAVASDMARSLVRATAAAVEALLARSLRAVGAAETLDGAPALRVLGSRDGVLRIGADQLPLARRHAEILLLLAEHPEGLSAEELAVLLSEDDLSDVTVRAEVSRLRRVVGPLLAQSRPYRLASSLRTDLDGVRAALASGDVGQALASCPGPVLARSAAPGVVAVRDALHADLRAAVLSSTDPVVIARWTASEVGAEDWWAWRRLAAVAPADSAHAVRARTRLASLDRALR